MCTYYYTHQNCLKATPTLRMGLPCAPTAQWLDQLALYAFATHSPNATFTLYSDHPYKMDIVTGSIALAVAMYLTGDYTSLQ